MIKSKVTSIKSGWKSVFMVFTSAAFDNPEMSANAFENVEQGLPNSKPSLHHGVIDLRIIYCAVFKSAMSMLVK
jgi:hypothetical protein